MAELVGDAYIRITADTDVMRRALSGQMKKAGKDDAGNYVRAFSDEVKANAAAEMKKAQRVLARALADPKVFDEQVKNFRSIDHAADEWMKKLRQLSKNSQLAAGDFDMFRDAIENWRVTAKKARADQDLMNKLHFEALKIDREITAGKRAAQKAEERLAAARKKAGTEHYGMLGRLSHRLSKFNIGRYFGKGSRNDFVNIVGSMIGGVGKLLTAPLALLGKAADVVFTTFTEGFKGVAEGASFFTKVGGGFASLGSAVASAAAAWPVLLAALAGVALALSAIAAILPMLISLMGLMATAVASLAGAITYGLTAAVLAAAPALVGLAAGLGAVGGAFYAFFKDKKNKKFVDDWKKQFTGFGKEFAPSVKEFLTSTSTGFKTLFEDITPSVTAFFSSWKKNMNDPTTKKGLGTISDSIGRIATTFNTALPNLLSGLVGFFQPILPYAERLATAIGNAFKRFDDWANSAEGKTAIGDFMKEAWADAKLVWEILKDIGSIIGSVFDFGSEEGTGFLEGIHGWLKKISDYLKDPANKDKIDKWFANAKEIGDNIGTVASGVGDIIKDLSSEQGQADAKKFMETMGKLAGHADTLADALTVISATSGIGAAASLFAGTEATDEEPAKPSMFDKYNQWSSDFNDSLTETWNTALDNVGTWLSEMGTTISTFFTELPGKVSTWFGGVVTSIQTGFQTGGTAIIDGVAGWLNSFATSIEEFDLSAWMTGVAENVGTFFVQLGMQIMAGLTTARTAISTWVTETWNSFTTWAGGVGTRVGAGLSALPGQVLVWLTQTRASIAQWVNDTLNSIQTWASGLPARIQGAITRVGAMLSALPGQVGAWLASLPSRLAAPFQQGWDRVNSYFNGAPGRLAAAAGRVIGAISGALSGVWSAITSPFRRAWEEVQRLVRLIGNIHIPTPKMPSISLPSWLPGQAAGNIFNGATPVVVGEAGPEAVVPLDRPLSMVNPSVRSMSAVLQAMTGGRGAAGGAAGPKVNFEAGAFQINLPTGDPKLAAEAVLDRLVAYI